MALSHDRILNPVTALGFYVVDPGSPVVLAGEGSYLKVFDATTNRLLSTCQVFDGQAIHGIAIRGDSNAENSLQIAIWGGSSLILLERKEVEGLLLQYASCITASVTVVSDWILDVAISPHDDTCVLITAHNTVLQARRVKDTREAKVATLSSPSRCILYSADLAWESHSQILVAAGTVFGEIILWRCSTTGESQVIYTFSGHEGSIFGVDISPPIAHPNGTTGRLLASCSDDRTIRIWDLATSFEPVSNSTSLMRETGFGENDEPNTPNVASRCIATVMGHASRIWSVKFLVGESHLSTPSSISVLSFGEDSTAQHWFLDFENRHVHTTDSNSLSAAPKHKKTPGSGEMAKLSQLNTYAFHSGKHIWSTATCHLTKSSCVLLTGGADGKISMCTLSAGKVPSPSPVEIESREEPIVSAMPAYEPSQSLSWVLEDIVSSFEPSALAQVVHKEPEPISAVPDAAPSETTPTNCKPSKSKKPKSFVKDGFNRYAFASESQMVATTNYGRVLIGDIDTRVVWSEALLPDTACHDLRSYTVMEGFPEIGIAFLAGSNGTIFAYQHGQSLQVAGKVEGKVADMFKIFNVRTSSYELLVTTLSSRIATLFVVEHFADASPQLLHSTSYNLPEKFVVTSAGSVNGLLAVGARSGLLAVYETVKGADPISIWIAPKDSAADAIATILPLTASTSVTGRFLTTERTGCYSIFSCTTILDSNDSPRGATICRIHHSRLPFGPMVEAAWFQNGELYFYGFKSKSFVVWNESKHFEVLNVDCGGAHRNYAYSPSSSSSGGYFVYTKASKLCLHSQRNPSHTFLKQGGHGREIKASAVSTDGGLIATGAEDTAIRIWRHKDTASDLDSRFDCLSIVEKHTTGIQHLQWHGSKYLFSSGGNEEFFIWAIRSIPDFGIGVICEASYPDRSVDGDLRIMSFDVTDIPSQSEGSDCLLISLAFSDSTIRTYAYSEAGRFDLLAVGRYTSSCLTQLRHVQVLNGRSYFLTAATDGKITLWKGDVSNSSDLKCRSPAKHAILSTRKIHQSTVKSLDMMISPSHFVVATGGDDNALAVSVYSLHCLHDFQLGPRIFIQRSAHSAAITALSIVSEACDDFDEGESSFHIITSGNDQRVKSWQVRVDPGTDLFLTREAKLDILQIGDVFTSVADVGDLSILSSREGRATKALVVGNGMDLWDISGKTASR